VTPSSFNAATCRRIDNAPSNTVPSTRSTIATTGIAAEARGCRRAWGRRTSERRASDAILLPLPSISAFRPDGDAAVDRAQSGWRPEQAFHQIRRGSSTWFMRVNRATLLASWRGLVRRSGRPISWLLLVAFWTELDVRGSGTHGGDSRDGRSVFVLMSERRDAPDESCAPGSSPPLATVIGRDRPTLLRYLAAVVNARSPRGHSPRRISAHPSRLVAQACGSTKPSRWVRRSRRR
jgi:hypothetical protein